MHMIQMAAASTASLKNNPAYQFARAHAFAVYPQRAVYTFIPKNACSTLRFSVAVANGFLTPEADVNWIHANNDAFIASQEYLATCDYAFVVLRCPFRRVASAYLDKIVGGERHLRGVLSPAQRGFYRAFGRQSLVRKIRSLSFEDFLIRISGQTPEQMDDHWRPQRDFLLYRSYDDYFALEAFDIARQRLAARGLRVLDTRRRLRHDTSHLERATGDYARTPGHVILREKAAGRVPDMRSLYSDTAICLVRAIYSADISLYREAFGGAGLLFPD